MQFAACPVLESLLGVKGVSKLNQEIDLVPKSGGLIIQLVHGLIIPSVHGFFNLSVPCHTRGHMSGVSLGRMPWIYYHVTFPSALKHVVLY